MPEKGGPPKGPRVIFSSDLYAHLMEVLSDEHRAELRQEMLRRMTPLERTRYTQIMARRKKRRR